MTPPTSTQPQTAPETTVSGAVPVSADAAAAHGHGLMGAGWSLRALAAAVGIAPSTLHCYLDRDESRGPLYAHVYQRLAAVEGLPRRASTQTTEPFVPRIGTVRRIQALLRMGWRHTDLRAATGLNTGILLSQSGRWVTRTTHEKIADAYRDLSARRGPSERTALRAERRGYAGPASWDDIDLDEAPAKPEELCAADGCLNAAEWTFNPGLIPDGIYLLCHRHGRDQRADRSAA